MSQKSCIYVRLIFLIAIRIHLLGTPVFCVVLVLLLNVKLLAEGRDDVVIGFRKGHSVAYTSYAFTVPAVK